jgi:hypothetical protein
MYTGELQKLAFLATGVSRPRRYIVVCLAIPLQAKKKSVACLACNSARYGGRPSRKSPSAQRASSAEVAALLRGARSAAIDAATLAAFESINFNLDEGRRELARLPTSCGGFGLRSISDHCGIAFVAATVAVHELFPAVLRQDSLDHLARCADSWLVLDDPVLLRFPPVAEFVTRYVDDGVAVRHAQRMLSRRLDRATSDALSPFAPPSVASAYRERSVAARKRVAGTRAWCGCPSLAHPC